MCTCVQILKMGRMWNRDRLGQPKQQRDTTPYTYPHGHTWTGSIPKTKLGTLKVTSGESTPSGSASHTPVWLFGVCMRVPLVMKSLIERERDRGKGGGACKSMDPPIRQPQYTRTKQVDVLGDGPHQRDTLKKNSHTHAHIHIYYIIYIHAHMYTFIMYYIYIFT